MHSGMDGQVANKFKKVKSSNRKVVKVGRTLFLTSWPHSLIPIYVCDKVFEVGFLDLGWGLR